MSAVTTGALLSLSLCLDIGIGNVAIMDISLKFGQRPAWYFGLGSVVGDLVYASLSVLGMGLLLHVPLVRWVCWLGGGLTMCWLALKMARTAFAAAQMTTGSTAMPTPAPAHLFARGIAIALASPSSMLWFAAVGGSLIAQATDGSVFEVGKLLGGFFLGGLAWLAFLITTTIRAGALLGHRFVQGAHLASAVLYVYFAVSVLSQGAREFL